MATKKHPNGFWKDLNNRLLAISRAGDLLGVTALDDWYLIRVKDVQEAHADARGVITYYQGSLVTALMDLYPDHAWLPWMFVNAPKHFWEDDDNVIWFMDWMGRKYSWTKPEDWYACTQADFEDSNGAGLVGTRFKGSHIAAIKWYHPDYEFQPWLFNCVPNKFWDNANNITDFFDWFAKKNNITTQEQWYAVTQDDLNKAGGSGLIGKYKGSTIAPLRVAYPTLTWEEWKFPKMERGGWTKPKKQREFLEALGKGEGYATWEDWYGLSRETVVAYGGGALLTGYYQGSIVSLVMSIFPEYEWLPWLFSYVPRGYFSKKENRTKYMKWLGDRLGYKKPEDWYKISQADFQSNYGYHLLWSMFRNVPQLAVMDYMPEYKWMPWKFNRVPKGWWYIKENRKAYLNWLASILGITSWEGWYKIKARMVKSNWGSALLTIYGGSPIDLLLDTFDHPWEIGKFIEKGHVGRTSHVTDRMARELNLDFIREQVTKLFAERG